MERQRVIASSRFLTYLDLSSNLACTAELNAANSVVCGQDYRVVLLSGRPAIKLQTTSWLDHRKRVRL